MKNQLRHTLHAIGCSITALVMLATGNVAIAQEFGVPGTEPFASQRAFESFQTETPWYDPTAELCGVPANYTPGSGSNPGATSGNWVSGQTPPFILEAFMIEVIKAVAHKRGVDIETTKVITEEHVIALVAFAIGEGGDINNRFLYNPLNTGIKVPDLLAPGWEHNPSGLQAFKSFDAGVEATARVMVGPNQSRLADKLMDPNSNAQQFMEALTYFNRYPGNKLWAEASLPPYTDRYYQERLRLVDQVRRKYAANAGLIIGTERFEFLTGETLPSKLQFHPTGSETPSAGGAGSTSAGGGSECVCTPKSGGNEKIIVLDPGHSGDSIQVIDPKTGIQDSDYPNRPEIEDVFDVSRRVERALTAAGYKVILTKSAAGETKTLRQRADVANAAKAALAVSIHTQAGSSGGLPFANRNNLVYPQAVDLYRQKPDGTKVTFDNADVAKTSQSYASIFAAERTAAEGHSVTVKPDAGSDIGDRGLAPGNIWLVQLFATVPWIYNEAGGNSTGQVGLNDGDKQKYANGLTNAVKKAVPLVSGAPQISSTADCATGGAVGGSLIGTIKSYAWPTYRAAPYFQFTPAYRKAVDDALARIRSGKNDYVGGGSNPGIDCGGFVTRVYRDSGVDPKYNDRAGNVIAQHAYVRRHPELYKRVKATREGELKPGMIYFNSDDSHTYMYIGGGVFPGWTSASASFSTSGASWRTPMASRTYDISGATWYEPIMPAASAVSTTTGGGTRFE